MGTTPNGIWYPDPAGTPRREDLQDLAESVDTVVGAMGEAIAYVPVLSTSTLGNGTITGSWMRVRDLAFFRIRLVLGSTTVISGPTFSLPIPAVDERAVVANVLMYDASAGTITRYHGGFVFSASDSTVLIRTDASARPDATTPFTWDVDDEINIAGSYEAA